MIFPVALFCILIKRAEDSDPSPPLENDLKHYGPSTDISASPERPVQDINYNNMDYMNTSYGMQWNSGIPLEKVVEQQFDASSMASVGSARLRS